MGIFEQIFDFNLKYVKTIQKFTFLNIILVIGRMILGNKLKTQYSLPV